MKLNSFFMLAAAFICVANAALAWHAAQRASRDAGLRRSVAHRAVQPCIDDGVERRPPIRRKGDAI